MKSITIKRVEDLKLPTGVLSLSLAPGTPDQQTPQVALGCHDGVYRWETSKPSAEKIYSHQNYVSSTAWLRSGEILSAGYDGSIRWFQSDIAEVVRKVTLHSFWSWDMAVSPDEKWVASVTGQYLAGGYKYEPCASTEPSVRIVCAQTGRIVHSLHQVPSVQAVAWSPDSRHVATGNLMGNVRVFDAIEGKLIAEWTTPDFTSWGIIKSHHYLGGIFAIKFTPDGNELLLAGMGEMRDPMAGNGRQLWQKWSWKEQEPKKTGETNKKQAGEGLMESLAIHPSGEYFAMGGRLRGGEWSLALFDLVSGERIAAQKTGYRVTDLCFSEDGNQLLVAGCQGQGKPKNAKFHPWGRLERYAIE